MSRNFWFHHLAIPKQLDSRILRRVLAYSKNMMVVEVEFKKGGVGSQHAHPHEQITYVVEGRFEFMIGGVKKEVLPGDSLYMEKEIIHGCLCLEDGKLLDIFTPYRQDFLEEESKI